MDKTINPYDLGKINIADICHKVSINSFVKKANTKLKEKLLVSEIDALGFKIKLGTSDTRFGGKRLWFMCPVCGRRIGIIYKHPISNLIGCRKCLHLVYAKQRFKGMAELEVQQLRK